MSTPHIFGVFLYLMFFEDILGIISFVVDEEGEISSARDYYACGEELRGLASPDPDGNKYQFTEKERDSETELDYFGARYYDSDIGRWTSVDPLADLRPGLSPYQYVQNNPLRRVDPDGKLDQNGDDEEKDRNVVGEGNAILNIGQMLDNNPNAVQESVVSGLQEGQEIANTISDLSGDAAIAALATGNLPAAADALIVSTAADVVSLGLEGAEYIVSGGDNSGELLTSAVTTGVGAFAGSSVKSFQKSIVRETSGGAKSAYRSAMKGSKGQFVNTSFGNQIMGASLGIRTALSLIF